MEHASPHVLPPESCQVMTWNVWFDAVAFDARFEAVIIEILKRQPHVVCLQEVTPRFASAVRASAVLGSLYVVSPNDVTPYGVLMLVCKAWRPLFREVELPSQMGRSLLVSEFAVRACDKGEGEAEEAMYAIATVHLESLNSERVRAEQLALCRSHLEKFPNAVLVGDFNFDARRTWGDWHAGATPREAGMLENTVLARVMPEWVDTWSLLRPDDEGLTFEGGVNPCVRDSGERMRYDRVMVKRPPQLAETAPESLLLPLGIERIGMTAIDSTGLRPSDHYGLVATFRLAERAPPRRCELQ